MYSSGLLAMIFFRCWPYYKDCYVLTRCVTQFHFELIQLERLHHSIWQDSHALFMILCMLVIVLGPRKACTTCGGMTPHGLLARLGHRTP